MPTWKNVEAPLTLIGLGRSGTSLVMDLFANHPRVQSLGETTNFIYSSYYQFVSSLPYCEATRSGQSVEAAAAKAVHAALVTTFPSRAPVWFHKPLRLPVVANRYKDDFHRFVEWYWNASRVLFPRGRFFTILRDPEEAAVSAMKRWKYEEGQVFRMIERNYEMMLGADSRLGCIVRFTDLTERREAAARRLFEFCGLRFDKSVLRSFERNHAPNPSGVSVSLAGPVPERVIALHRELERRAERFD